MSEPRLISTRHIVLGAGVMLVFVSLMRVIYLESAAVAHAYDIRALREQAARLENANHVLQADVATLKTIHRLDDEAKKLNFVEAPLDEVPSVRLGRENQGKPLAD